MKKGLALIAVVMVVMILSILGFSFLNMATLEALQVRRTLFYFKALDIAEAGLERAMWKLTKQPNWRDGWNNVSFGDGYYTVNLSNLSSGNILITSTGICRSISKTVKAEVQVSSSSTTPSISFTSGTSSGNLGDFPGQVGDIGQSFRTGSSPVQVGRVEMQIKKDNPNVSSIYMTIRTGSTVGAILGQSNIINPSQIPSGTATWISFEFNPPVQLQANTKYYLRLSSIPPSTNPLSGAQGKIHVTYAPVSYRRIGPVNPGNPDIEGPEIIEVSPYTYGEAYRYIGKNNNPGYTGEQLMEDFNFRIFGPSSATVKIINWSEEPYQKL
jgi:Tfp pilus assembly protein PilX